MSTPPVSRRSAVTVVGVAGLGSVALAGCTSQTATTSAGAPSAAAGGSTAGSGGAGAGSAGIPTSEIPVGGGKIFEATDTVVTQPTAGVFKAFSATCTHQGCKVTKVASGHIICPCHNSEFDITTGDATHGPATAPLPAKTVTVSGSTLTVA